MHYLGRPKKVTSKREGIMYKHENVRIPVRVRIFSLVLILTCTSSLIISCGGGGNTTYSEKRNLSSASNRGNGKVFISPKSLDKQYTKVAVLPFKSQVEIAGASVADMVTTEILKTYKYELIERGQIEQILQEQSLSLQGVTENTIAMQVGKILDVQGVIVGTVPEFDVRSVNGYDVPAVGINIRMIDTQTGSIIWTVSDSAISRESISISTFADKLVESMIEQLRHEWIRHGDTFAVNLPSPQIVSSQGHIRKATIRVHTESTKKVQSYTLLRSRTKGGHYTKIKSLNNSSSKTIVFEDTQLLDAETYYYKVVALYFSGLNGLPAGPVKVITIGAPGSLSYLTAKSGGLRECKITWQSSTDTGVAGYDILRAVNNTGTFKKITHVKKRDSSEYLDKGTSSYSNYGNLKDNFTYYYKIRVVNVVGVQSPDSSTVSATTEGIPPTVSNLQAQHNMLRKIGLTWNPSTDKYVKGYEILRSESETGPYSSIKIINGKDKNEYVDKGANASWGEAGKLADKTDYYYTIKSINHVDIKSQDSNIATATTRGKPPVVTGVLAEGGLPRKVNLLWQPSSGDFVDSYVIYRSTSEAGPFVTIKNISGRDKSEFMDKGTGSSWGDVGELLDNTTYFYQVRSINIVDVASEESTTVSAVTKPMLSKITGLSAIENQARKVTLSWDSSDGKEFEIFRGETPSSVKKEIATVGSKTLKYIDTKLEDEKQYFYKVRAVDSFDLPGVFSDLANATTKPLPSKPTNLTHSTNGTQLILSWNANPENDISTYKVLKKGFFSWGTIGDTVETSFSPAEQLEKGDKDLYQVIAVDSDGLQSLPSNEIKVVVPK